MGLTKAGVVVAALAALTAGVGSASASGQTDYSTFFVEFELSRDAFVGKIDSRKGKCVRERKIVLYRKRDGDKRKLAADKTNKKGKFKIGVGDSPKDGRYFAVASSKSVGDGNCRPEKSAKVVLG